MLSAALLLSLAATAADAPKPVPAKITITAEVCCAHCTFGIESEGGCAACLKLDDKTPVLVKGKAAEVLFKERFGKKVFVVEGTLAQNKEKLLVLDLTAARERTDADKGKAPEVGQARVTGSVTAKEGVLTLQNGEVPVTVESKAAPADAKPVTYTGKLGVKDGKPRLEAGAPEPAQK